MNCIVMSEEKEILLFKNEDYSELHRWLQENYHKYPLNKGNATLEEIKNCFAELEELYVGGDWEKAKQGMPTSIRKLKNLKRIGSSYAYKNLIDNLDAFKLVEELEFSLDKLTSFPTKIKYLFKLKNLMLQGNFPEIPEAVGNLKKLEKMKILSESLSTIPDSIGNLTNLQELIVASESEVHIPSSIGNLQNLCCLVLNTWEAPQIPDTIGHLHQLKKLSITSKQLFPQTIGQLLELESLNIRVSDEQTLPPEELHNYLACLLPLKKLKRLSLDINNLRSLPEWLYAFQELRFFRARDLKCAAFPLFLRHLPKIQDIYLRHSNISMVPEWIGELKELIILDLVGNNHIYELPDSIGHLEKLQEVRLSTSLYFALYGEGMEEMEAKLPPQCKLVFMD